MADSPIFYSWQSDLPPEGNRTLILECLERAVVAVRADGSLTVEPVIDRDTAGVPGAPEIVAAILEKIDACDVFVCDVSIIGRTENQRPMPNPNVLLELGYALKTKGWGRVLLVMNEVFGGPTELPFDLRTRRVVAYRAGGGVPADFGAAALEAELTAALRLLYEGFTPTVEPQEPIPSAADTEWAESHRALATAAFPAHFSMSIDVFATVSPKPRRHTSPELLEIADASQVHTFGWPIGVMSRMNPQMTPSPTNDGIAARIEPGRGSFDYWAIRCDGSFYMLKSLYEEHEKQHRTLFFDTRVMRAAEVCLYLHGLYERLGVPQDSRVYLRVRFNGIAGAMLRATPTRPFFHEHGPSVEAAAVSEITTTVAALRAEVVDVVKAITRPLFVLFGYFELSDEVYRTIVESYVQGRIT